MTMEGNLLVLSLLCLYQTTVANSESIQVYINFELNELFVLCLSPLEKLSFLLLYFNELIGFDCLR